MQHSISSQLQLDWNPRCGCLGVDVSNGLIEGTACRSIAEGEPLGHGRWDNDTDEKIAWWHSAKHASRKVAWPVDMTAFACGVPASQTMQMHSGEGPNKPPYQHHLLYNHAHAQRSLHVCASGLLFNQSSQTDKQSQEAVVSQSKMSSVISLLNYIVTFSPWQLILLMLLKGGGWTSLSCQPRI